MTKRVGKIPPHLEMKAHHITNMTTIQKNQKMTLMKKQPLKKLRRTRLKLSPKLRLMP